MRWFALFLAGCSTSPLSGVGGDGGAAQDLAVAADMAAPADMALAPPMRIASGVMLLAGVTSDDNAIVYDYDQNQVAAIPIAGGPPSPVAPLGIAVVVGKTVFVWTNYDQATQTGTLTAWTAATGPKMIGAGASIRAFAAANDAPMVLYLGSVTQTGADAVMFRLDGPGAIAKIAIGLSATCPPFAVGGGKRILLAHCLPNSQTAVVDEIDADGKTPTLAQPVFDFVTSDAAGDTALTIDTKYVAQAWPEGGQPSAPLAMDAIWGALSADGQYALVQSLAGGLRRVPVGNGAPSTVADKGVTGVWGTSRAADAALFYQTYDQMSFLTDLWLASPKGQPVQLVKANTGCVYGDPFTVDGSFALYMTDCMPNYTGALHAAAVGGLPKPLASGTWATWAAGGARVAYNANYAKAGIGNGRADLAITDLSTGATTPLAQQAEVDFFLSHDRTRAVYAWQSMPGAEGLYVAPLP